MVVFFDPACETCRAFYPIVKAILKQYPNKVGLMIRYAPLHKGSEAVVERLEAPKRQGKYQEVLEAVLEAQPAQLRHRPTGRAGGRGSGEGSQVRLTLTR